MKIISLIAVCGIALSVSARPEGGYRYSSPLLPISGPGGHSLSAGPCCQQLALLKGGGSGHGFVGSGNGLIGSSNGLTGSGQALIGSGHGIIGSGHGNSGFGQGHSAIVSSSYAASGAGGYLGGHGLGLQALATPTPVAFSASIPAPPPVLGAGYSHGGSAGYSGFTGGFNHGGSFNHKGSFGHGGAIGHNGASIFHGGLTQQFGGSNVGVHGLADFKPPLISPGGFSAVDLSSGAGSFGASSIETHASIGSHSVSDNSGSTLIQKHIYVHVPPPDPDDHPHPAKIASLVQPRKHYKIIFIKAPTVQQPSIAQLVANNALTEEKTLVYVLVKKPEEPSIEHIQAIQNNVHHHKPEVYFIKYKAKNHPHNLAGSGLAEASFDSGAALSEANSATSFASGSGVSLTSNIGSDHNIVHVTPSPTPYLPPLIEPRAPEHDSAISPHDTYGPPPDVV